MDCLFLGDYKCLMLCKYKYIMLRKYKSIMLCRHKYLMLALENVFKIRHLKCLRARNHCPLSLPRSCLLTLLDSRVNPQYIRLF